MTRMTAEERRRQKAEILVDIEETSEALRALEVRADRTAELLEIVALILRKRGNSTLEELSRLMTWNGERLLLRGEYRSRALLLEVLDASGIAALAGELLQKKERLATLEDQRSRS